MVIHGLYVLETDDRAVARPCSEKKVYTGVLLGLRLLILGGQFLGAARVYRAPRGAGAASNAEPARGRRATVSFRAPAMPHHHPLCKRDKGLSHSSSSFFATVCFRTLPVYTSGMSQQGSAGCSSVWSSAAQRAATASHSVA